MSVKGPAASVESERSEGNRLFGERDFAGALAHYSAALVLLGACASDSPDADVFATLHANAAECHLKLGNASSARSARSACDSALGMRPAHIKALHRRARACEALGDTAAATTDLKRILQVDAQNREVGEMLRRLQLTEHTRQSATRDWCALEAVAVAHMTDSSTVDEQWAPVHATISFFASASTADRAAIVSQSRIPHALVAVLQRISTSSLHSSTAIATSALRALNLLATSSPQMDAALLASAIPSVCTCLRTHTSNAQSTAAAAAALTSIGSDARVRHC